MILMTRVDCRLLHGQTAVSWTSGLGADCILIANDAVITDELRKTTMKLAKPAGTKLVIKNMEDSITALKSGVTDKYRLFIVVESIEDAAKLALAVPEVDKVNLGLVKAKEAQEIKLPAGYRKVLLNNYKEIAEDGQTIRLQGYQVLVLEMGI